MKKTSKKLAICLAAVFLVSALVPATSSTTLKVEKKIAQENKLVNVEFSFFRANGMVDTITKKLTQQQAEKLANIIESFNKALSRANNKREIKAVFDDFLGQLSIFGFLSDALHGMLCWTGSFITGGLPPLMPGLLPPKTVWHLGGFIQSFGAGRVDIPYYGSRVSSKGVLLRPIWWQYGVFAFTKIRDAHLIMPRVDTYLLFGRHSGFMLGFVGLYIKIPRLILRDIHFFLGWSPLIRTTDYGLSSWL